MTLGVFLLACYTIVAFFCIINFNADPARWRLTDNGWYFLYLYIAVMMLLWPFLMNAYETRAKIETDASLYKTVAWVYIILAAFACVVYFPVAYDAIVNPQWTDLYEEAHEVQERSLLIRMANLFFHLRYLGVTLLFFFMTKKGQSKLFKILLWVMALLPLLLVTISHASRGGFIEIFVAFLMSYLIFRNSLPKGVIKLLRVFVMVAVPLAVVYISAVTIARFEDSPFANSAEDSVIYYLGLSMLTFVYGVADSINKYAWGDYMLTSGFSPELATNGTHFGASFTTIVGSLYLDFGPIVSILLILLFNMFWKKLSKRTIGIPEAFMLITWGQTLFRGVFVLGRTWGIQLIEALIIYVLLRWLQKRRTFEVK